MDFAHVVFEQRYCDVQRLSKSLGSLEKATQKALTACQEVVRALESVSFAFRSSCAHHASSTESQEASLDMQQHLRAVRENPKWLELEQQYAAQSLTVASLMHRSESVEVLGKKRGKAQQKVLQLSRRPEKHSEELAAAELVLTEEDERFTMEANELFSGTNTSINQMMQSAWSSASAAFLVLSNALALPPSSPPKPEEESSGAS